MLDRRSLHRLLGEGRPFVCSRPIADEARVSAAQLRLKRVAVEHPSFARCGYPPTAFAPSVAELDGWHGKSIALVGLGKLGRAIVSNVSRLHSNLPIVAAFDEDFEKAGKVIHGCRCYCLDERNRVVREKSSKVAIVAVPNARGAAYCRSPRGRWRRQALQLGSRFVAGAGKRRRSRFGFNAAAREGCLYFREREAALDADHGAHAHDGTRSYRNYGDEAGRAVIKRTIAEDSFPPEVESQRNKKEAP